MSMSASSSEERGEVVANGVEGPAWDGRSGVVLPLVSGWVADIAPWIESESDLAKGGYWRGETEWGTARRIVMFEM